MDEGQTERDGDFWLGLMAILLFFVSFCAVFSLLFNFLGLFCSQAETGHSSQGEVQEEEAGADEMQLFTDDKFDPEFRVTTWHQTILGQLITV